MSDFVDINASVQVLPVADLQFPQASSESANLTFDQFERTKAVEDINIRKIEVRERTLLKIKNKVDILTTSKFPLSEIFLAVSTLSIGGIIGALSSKLSTDDNFGKAFYLSASILFVGFGVAYFFTRYLENQKPHVTGEELKEVITDIFGDE